LLVVGAASADIEIPGLPPEAAGTDGTLVSNSHLMIDLGKAQSGAGITWQSPGGDVDNDGIADGVYDPAVHAVVFKYSGVSLGGGGYWLQFTNHPKGASVVWLVTGNVTLTSQHYISLTGGNSQGSSGFAVPGPGGFRGARGGVGETPASGGFGPGGGDFLQDIGWGGGSFGEPGGAYSVPAAPTYNNVFILPLIGGSGGAGWSNGGGGAGGGAIMIVCTGTVTLNGAIYANGGGGNNYGAGGAGGAIRIIADQIIGNSSGVLRAQGGGGGYDTVGGRGRIFLQANYINMSDVGDPAAVKTNFAQSPYLIWPDSTDPGFPDVPPTPKIWPVSLTVDGTVHLIRDDPSAAFEQPGTEVSFDTTNPVTLQISAAYVPLDWKVIVRVVAAAGSSFTVEAPALAGSLEASSTEAVIESLPRGFGAIQVRAYDPDRGVSLPTQATVRPAPSEAAP